MRRKLIIIIIALFPLVLNVLAPAMVMARTPEEIQKDIDAKQKQLSDLQKSLDSLQNQIKNNSSQKTSNLSQVADLQNQLAEIDQQTQVNSLQKQQLEQEIDLKVLEKEGKQKQQDAQVSEAYMEWKSSSTLANLLSDEDIIKNIVYNQFVTEQSRNNILGISTEIDTLNRDNDQYKQQLADLERDSTALSEQKTALQQQIASLDKAIASANTNAAGIKSQTQALQQQIDGLSQEWIQAQTDFNNLVGNGANSGTEPLVSGQLYIAGTATYDGNDPKQTPLPQTGDGFGHGIGMSQWGAYGGAAKGMSAAQILGFYYSSTSITTISGKSISVQGHGTMSMEDYVSGLGEIPSKACGTQQQITDWKAFADGQGWSAADPRRSKYVPASSNPWNCWPEEAIKAQVIAARSYAFVATRGLKNSICTSASCQVYAGGQGKAWAAFETKDQYVAQNSNPIEAFYSSYNNNGWGTSDSDTLWSDKNGNGTYYSYLRSVNDSAFTYNYSYKHRPWRTNSYSLQSLDSMISWCAVNCSSASFVSSVKSKIGQISSLTTIKDGSGRVKKVVIKGTTGQTVTLAGWYFVEMFNVWVSKVHPSGQSDYMQSLTFSILSAQ